MLDNGAYHGLALRTWLLINASVLSFPLASPLRADDKPARPPAEGVKVSGRVFGMIAAEKGAKPVQKPAGAAVHLRDLPRGWSPKPSAEPVTLQLIKGRLVPEFACLQVDQKLVVKAPRGEAFDLQAHSRERAEYGRTVPADPKVFTDSFPRPDDYVSLSCAINPDARAHLQVVPTPGFALCDAEGRFTLPRRLPAGRHVLRGFLPGMGWGEKAITLRGDEGEVSVDIELAPRSKVRPPRGPINAGYLEGESPWSHRFLTFTPDDKHLLTIGYDAAIRIWDVRTGKRLRVLWLPRGLVAGYNAHYADLSPDGRRLAFPCGHHFLVIDLRAGRVTAVGRGHAGSIHLLAFSPDGRRIGTVGYDRLLKLWDPDTGACTATFRGPGSQEFYALAWSPDGKTIVTSEMDGPLRLWDVASGKVRNLTRRDVYAERLLWRPDGKAIALMNLPRYSWIMDLSGKIISGDEPSDHWNSAAARFTADGRLALAEHGRVVDAFTGKQVGPCPGHPRIGDEAALSAAGDLYASWEEDGRLVVRSLIDGKVRMDVAAPPRDIATKVGFSADGQSLLWTAVPRPGKSPEQERAFDLATLTLGVPPTRARRTAARLNDAGRQIVKGEHDYGYTLHRIREGTNVTIEPSSSADDFGMKSITLLADERAALHSDWGLALHDTRTGKELFYYRPAPEGDELAPSPDGRFFAAGGRTISIYSLTSPDRLLALHVLGDCWVAWTRDGDYAASWDGDLPVGHLIDNGPDQLADFVPLNQIEGRNRPDVIRRLLAGPDTPRQSRYKRAVQMCKPALVTIAGLPKNETALGFLIDARGTVVANSSLLGGKKKLTVVLADGRRLAAKVVRSDPDLDLAMIRVEDGKDLPQARVGDSEKVKEGDCVLALWTPWRTATDELPAITVGIISGTARMKKKGTTLLLVDTAIGPGCGPGPLINAEGEFIGLVVSRDLGPQGRNSALPSKRIRERVAEWLREKSGAER